MATKTLLTLEQFEQLPDNGMRHELDEGELISMPSPFTLHGKVQARTTILLDFAHQRSLGLVVTDTGFRLSHDTVRAPDVSFIRAERANGLELERRFEGAPDLAVEIISERWVRSVKEECLSRLILFGESSLRRAVTAFAEHYHRERNHQGKENVLLFPAAEQR